MFQTDVDWIPVLGSDISKSQILHLKQKYSAYMFGLAVSSAEGYSGITWADCLYDKRQCEY